MHTLNKELSRIFEEIGNIYEFLGKDNRFRSVAYYNASMAINDLPESILNYIHEGKIEKVHGIGKKTSDKILEYIHTGKIEKYEELKTKIPRDFIELLHVQGLGPETLKRLNKELKVSTKEELLKVLKDGSVLKLKGFKKKKVNNLLESLGRQKIFDKRMGLWEAIDLSETIIKILEKFPEIKKIEVAGSLRRKNETIGDVDVLIAANSKDSKKIIRRFIETEEVSKVLAEGDTKASLLLENYQKQIDLRIISEDEWGAALQYFTGSKSHNVHLRRIAIDKGYKINEYGMFNLQNNEKIAGKTEEEMYEKLGLAWIPPEMRQDNGEIELAASGNIPKLVTLADIKGDMHTHSKWSDGSNSIEEIIKYADKHLNYEYLVLTDHSKSQHIAGGMDENEFADQIKVIKEVNKKHKRNLLKAGAEVDILPDGSLDLDDSLLERLDWVVASIHTRFKKDNTDRIIKACENPFVNVIGHPTGRIIGSRDAYPVDMDKVIEAAAATGTALEINANPFRMDLNSRWARLAMEKGVKLVISTDSHNTSNYSFMKLGVYIARRGWCRPQDILNTMSWDEIIKFKNAKRKLKLEHRN